MANKIQLSKRREFDITVNGDTYAGVHAMPYVTAALRSPDTVAKGYVRTMDGLTKVRLSTILLVQILLLLLLVVFLQEMTHQQVSKF